MILGNQGAEIIKVERARGMAKRSAAMLQQRSDINAGSS